MMIVRLTSLSRFVHIGFPSLLRFPVAQTVKQDPNNVKFFNSQGMQEM